MNGLSVRRVNFSKEADTRMKRLKGQTGVTPNLFCRIGFCMSLEDPTPVVASHHPPGPRDINRYTLTGDFDSVMVALLRQRLAEDGLDWDEHASEQFRLHMNRGVHLVAMRATSIHELMTAADNTTP